MTIYRSHFQDALLERYGIETTSADEAEMTRLCRDSEAVLLKRQTEHDGAEWWAVTWAGQVIRLCYHRQQDRIRTALPLQCIQKNAGGQVLGHKERRRRSRRRRRQQRDKWRREGRQTKEIEDAQ